MMTQPPATIRYPRPGVLRHTVSDAAATNFNGEESVLQTLVTVQHGGIIGDLVRYIWDDGGFVYEARINGLPETYGLADIACALPESLATLMQVCHDLSLEWRILNGEFASEGITWTV